MILKAVLKRYGRRKINFREQRQSFNGRTYRTRQRREFYSPTRPPGLDRSHRRFNVLGQIGGTDPPPAPRQDRAPEGSGLQAQDRRALLTRSHRLALGDASRILDGRDGRR